MDGRDSCRNFYCLPVVVTCYKGVVVVGERNYDNEKQFQDWLLFIILSQNPKNTVHRWVNNEGDLVPLAKQVLYFHGPLDIFENGHQAQASPRKMVINLRDDRTCAREENGDRNHAPSSKPSSVYD
eukprot:scaffold4244_cov167-Amphora_coffeaeformis.AAC.25